MLLQNKCQPCHHTVLDDKYQFYKTSINYAINHSVVNFTTKKKDIDKKETRSF
jgi:hypothetical protein